MVKKHKIKESRNKIYNVGTNLVSHIRRESVPHAIMTNKRLDIAPEAKSAFMILDQFIKTENVMNVIKAS